MMGSGHAASGATVWLTGCAWVALADLAQPGIDVLTVGTLVCAGSALVPDLDHPKSRIAQFAGPVTGAVAVFAASFGAWVHDRTKLDADRPDEDGHRTLLHTFAFALFAGAVVAAVGASADWLGDWMATETGWPIEHFGKLPAAAVVYVLVHLGYAAARSALGGRQRRMKLGGKRRRWRKATVTAWAAAIYAFVMVPADTWWIPAAVTIGCATHCLGDMLTHGGCPVLWPIPIPSTVPRYNRKLRRREPVRVWRTWHLAGTPRWMRFRVGGHTERVVTNAIIAVGVLAVAGLVYAGFAPAV